MNFQTEAPPLEVDTERSVGRSVELRPGHHETHVSVTFHNSPQQPSHRKDEAHRDDTSGSEKNVSVHCELFPNGDKYKSVDRNVWDRLEKNRTLEHQPSSGASHAVIETGVGVAHDDTFVHNVLDSSEVNATPSIQYNHHQQDKENYYQTTNVMFAHNVLEPTETEATPDAEEKQQQQNNENYYQPADIRQIYEQEPLTRGQVLPPWDVEQNLQLNPGSQAHFDRYHWQKGTRKEGNSWNSAPEVILHGVPKDVRYLVLSVRPLHTKLN